MVRKTFCSIKVLFITTAALVVLFVAVLVLAFIGVPRLINSQLEKQVHLEKGTTQWDRFVEIPFALDFKIWLFNVTNPEEIVTGAKPVLKEIGPFYYTFTIKKNIISTNPSDDTVTYDRDMTFTYNQELSGSLKEDEELVFLNPVMLSISQMSSLIERMALNGCLDKIFPSQYNDIFIKTKVRTMFFDGYEFAVKNDDIGVACGIIRNKIIEKTAAVRTIDRIYKNGEVYSLKFAYFHYKESKTDGVYTVFRGLDDVSLLGQVFRWNDEPQLSFWGRAMSVNNETCNRVRGTDATIFQPFINKDSVVEIYNTDICRIIRINYAGQGSYKGVDGLRFTIDENTFRPATQYPENDCFCTQQTLDVDGSPSCYLDGVVDLKTCIGAPILLSFPHFLFADEKYRKAVDGITEPDESIHKIFLLVEPNTGTPLEGRKRAQFNMALRPASYMTLTENLPRAVLPLLWVEEGVSLPDKYIDEINSKYFNALKVANGVKYGIIAVTLAAVVTSTGFLVRKKFFTAK